MQAHGAIELGWLGVILRIESDGLFNEEGVLACLPKYQNVILEANKSHWLQLDVWGELTLGTPQAFARAVEAYQWSFEHGCRALAIVTSNSIQAGMVDSVIKPAITAPLSVFTAEAEAQAWLKTQLDASAPAGI